MKKTKTKQRKNTEYKKSDFVYDLHNGTTFVSQGNKTLNSLREHALAYKATIEDSIVYRVNVKTGSATKLSLSKYAFKNKIYAPSRSLDKSGFYYEWSWEKKTPFEQPPIKPLPKSFSEKNDVVIDASMPMKKPTFLQKVKRYILNMFE